MAQTEPQTHTHTDGHGNSMTNSAQWGRVGENDVFSFWLRPNVTKANIYIQGNINSSEFSPTWPHWAELVIELPCPFMCLSVCLCHRETPTSGGRLDLWSKIAFLILVWDDTIFKKGGVQFFSKIVKNC